MLGYASAEQQSIHQGAWPAYDEALLEQSSVTIGIQVNGKVRGTILVTSEMTEGQVLAAAKGVVGQWLQGKAMIKELYVPGKIVNFVVE